MTIDSSATWNSQMERAELIPQTTANLGTGQQYYHFSLKRSSTNVPDVSGSAALALSNKEAYTSSYQSTLEHQIAFFESHFTEVGTVQPDITG